MQALLPLAQEVALLLKARHETIAIAESSAGVLIAAALLAVPGASAYFLGGAVVYTRKAREQLMQLPREAVTGMRSASEPYALLLASLLLFGCFPRLLTEKMTPDLQKIVVMANAGTTAVADSTTPVSPATRALPNPNLVAQK
jgi:hypothetical protein